LDNQNTGTVWPARRALPIICRNAWGEWALAFVYCAAFGGFMLVYHDLWRNKTYSLGTFNEAMALAGLWGLASALALGPVYRLTGRGYDLCRLRRPLGILGALLGIAHGLVTLLVLNGTYDWAYYAKHLDCLTLGIAAALLLAALAVTSTQAAVQRLGDERWTRFQKWGWVALAVVAVHFLILGKPTAWWKWYQTRDLPAPPGTFVVTVVAVLALILKAADAWRPPRGEASASSEPRRPEEK